MCRRSGRAAYALLAQVALVISNAKMVQQVIADGLVAIQGTHFVLPNSWKPSTKRPGNRTVQRVAVEILAAEYAAEVHVGCACSRPFAAYTSPLRSSGPPSCRAGDLCDVGRSFACRAARQRSRRCCSSIFVCWCCSATLVAWQLVALWLERRRGLVGARLHLRLVLVVRPVAVGCPTIFISTFSVLSSSTGWTSSSATASAWP